MKKNITYLCMATAALLAPSCTQNEEIIPTIDNDRVAVRFSSNMASLETKSVDGTWNALPVGIYMLDAENSPIESNAQYKVTTTGEASSDLTPTSTPLYYPTDGSNVSFKAYHPGPYSYFPDMVKVENDTWTANLSDQTNTTIEYLDLKTATTANSYNKKTVDPVSLSFEHRLAYVNILIAEFDRAHISDSDVQNMTVKLTNQPTTVHYGILTDELSADATDTNKGDITMAVKRIENDKYFRALVYPGVSNDSKFVFSIPNKNMTFETELPDVTFAPGTQYNYSVKLNYAPATAKFTASITDWKTVDMTDTSLEANEISE